MNRPLIFLCHSSLDKPFVRRLVERLRRDGVDCWVDEYEIRIGDSIHGKINDGLRRSDFFAVVLSKASLSSRWVQDELASASSLEKYSKQKVLILPLLLEHCDLPPLLLDRRYANFADDPQSAYVELLDSIRHHFAARHPDVDVAQLPLVEPTSDTLAAITSDPGLLDRLPPRHFEELVAELLDAAGYDVALTPLTRDGGFDVVAFKESGLPGVAAQRMIVQCKHWKNPVGVSQVRELAGTREVTGASRALLVSTSRFTQGATRAAESTGIELVDRALLVEWIAARLKSRQGGGSSGAPPESPAGPPLV